MEEKIKIGIICRANPKWNTLYEILNDNSDELEYKIYDVSNPKWEYKYKEDNVEFDGYIFLATMPKFTNKPYIQLKASATEEDICSKISELFDSLNNNEENNEENIKDDCSDNNPSGTSSIPAITTIDLCNSDNDLYASVSEDNNDNSNSINSIGHLIGIKIIICEKEVVLNKDDACKLKELIEFAKDNNYKIIDVITSD